MATSEVSVGTDDVPQTLGRISRACKQYLYSPDGKDYLDCLNGTSHVGHAHPQVVSAAISQMSKLSTAQGYVSEWTMQFVKQLASTMPYDLNVIYLCNSAQEANDLALRMARRCTNNHSFVTMEGAYHGHLSATLEVSPKYFGSNPERVKKDYIHVLPMPVLKDPGIKDKDVNSDEPYDGSFKLWEMLQIDSHAEEAEKMLRRIKCRDEGLAGFICDPMFTASGVHCLPGTYLKRVYKAVKECGGVCIADESSAGLGRTGSHFWSFQRSGVTPDIVTLGNNIGNGHPLGAVICQRQVASAMNGYYSTFGGNPVSCAIGLSVLRILRNEKLMFSAQNIGKLLKSSLTALPHKYPCVTAVRGDGLIWGVEVTGNQEDLESKKLAIEIVKTLKDDSTILAGISGVKDNVILFTPPMCFTMENARRFVAALETSIKKVSSSQKGAMKRSHEEDDINDRPPAKSSKTIDA